MHKLLFIHIILQPSTCFEQFYAHPQEVTLYTCSIWYRHSLWAAVVFVRCTGWSSSAYRFVDSFRAGAFYKIKLRIFNSVSTEDRSALMHVFRTELPTRTPYSRHHFFFAKSRNASPSALQPPLFISKSLYNGLLWQELSTLLRTREVSSSNIGRYMNYPYGGYQWFSL
jgi:hypothetical protein